MSTPPASRKPLRQRLTGIGKAVMHRTGMIRLARHLGDQGQTLPIVRYHCVADNPDYCPLSISVPATMFDREIHYLARHYQVITVETAIQCVEAGRPFPRDSVAITFDDGYKDNVEVAMPILRKHGVSAMFYVAAGPTVLRQPFWVGWLQQAVVRCQQPEHLRDAYATLGLLSDGGEQAGRQHLIDGLARHINNGDSAHRQTVLDTLAHILDTGRSVNGTDFMMDSADLHTLVEAGMEVGSHTVSHPLLNRLPEAEANTELRESKRLLEDVLQRPVEHLAYPNGPGNPGNFDAATIAQTRAAGYRSAVTSERGALSQATDLFAIPRHGVNYKLNFDEFVFKVEEHRFKSLLLGAS